MTNAKILSMLRQDLETISKEYSRVGRMPRTRETEAYLDRLEEQMENLALSIEDLEGAIACGADDPNPLAGWCN